MLRIKNLKGDPSAIIDYAENKKNHPDQKSGYYDAKGAPSAWGGALAADLGLSGSVQAADLKKLLSGELSDGTRFAKEDPDRRLGIDMSFSAPKSVSLAALVGGDERIIQAHDAAVRTAMSMIEQEYATARFGHAGRNVVCSGKLVYAAYRHEDARTVDDIADPQLHTHCIVSNITIDPETGKPRSIDFAWGQDGIKLAGAMYRAELARRLKEMGYELRKSEEGFELAQISDEQVETFSRRRVQVDQALEQQGTDREHASSELKTAVTLATRQGKAQLSAEDQYEEWQQRAAEAELDLSQPVGPRVSVTPPEIDLDHTFEHLSERASVINKDAVRLDALINHMSEGATLSTVDKAIQGAAVTGDVFEIEDGIKRKIITRETLKREQQILLLAQQGRGVNSVLIGVGDTKHLIEDAEQAQGFRFSEGQRRAINLTATTTDQVSGIVGAAGAGKTTAMKTVADLAKSQGLTVVGIAPSSAAADELKSAGADDTMTLATFNLKGEAAGPRLLILDEAGMVSARDGEALLKKLGKEDRLIFVGDPKQLAAVEAGSPFAQLMRSGAIQYAEITEINRQKDQKLLDIAQHFAKGKAEEAVALATKYVTEVPVTLPDKPEHKITRQAKTEARRLAIASATAKRYLELSQEERATTLVLSGTNAVRKQVNEQVRKGLIDKGEINGESFTVSTLDKADMTRAKMRKAGNYKPGQVIKTAGKQAEQSEVVAVNLDQNLIQVKLSDGTLKSIDASRFDVKKTQVFNPRQIDIAAGDKIIFTNNDQATETKNNQIGLIEEIKDGKAIINSNGAKVEIDIQRKLHIDHAYCITIHRSQGQTVDSVIVAGEASRTTTAEAAYVACTRERYKLEIITDNTERLSKNWVRYADRQTAAEALKSSEEKYPHLDEIREELRRELQQELERQEPTNITPELEIEMERSMFDQYTLHSRQPRSY
ncbi:MobF family relaxase [Halothiobacillus neapolitanus]|uniref:Conjugative relaxase domain protein n=1 Tax=Halothiobacillus neapolitanus (strain ATCC 23641 / DSM 15147 / CIP 104769 / NCIMB 8539 / c2) TaxID=555778 RepID=D0KZB2_HALNC|nr:MobF family relaxase [Halothiobacillus neapolitanus]ACX95785.1 conjugative relaxase domain protein [Halothiobacillus neapolitanus c2]TDN66093.1 conjugative relaxase-like TrwC/TraI family protein [Halothiobacillus neapolitanus]